MIKPVKESEKAALAKGKKDAKAANNHPGKTEFKNPFKPQTMEYYHYNQGYLQEAKPLKST